MKRHGFASVLIVCSLVACSDVNTPVGSWAPPDASDGLPVDAGIPDRVDAEPAMPSAFYLEAEAGALSGAFEIGKSSAASGGAFIVASEAAPTDAPGPARAVYSFALEQAGNYVIWGRIHSPGAENNRFWLRVDDGPWFLWRISTGDVFYWDDIHDNLDYANPLIFPLTATAHRLELANAVTLAKLDRFYITREGDHPPGNTTPCNPPHSIEQNGLCLPSCGSQGNVSCLPDECQGRPVLEAYDCEVCCLLE